MDQATSKVIISGKPLKCPHCGGDEFIRAEAQLNTAFMSFLGWGWMNRSASLFQCGGCGRIEWFYEPDVTGQESPMVVSEHFDDTSQATDCIQCGATIPAGQDACPKCHWTYR